MKLFQKSSLKYPKILLGYILIGFMATASLIYNNPNFLSRVEPYLVITYLGFIFFHYQYPTRIGWFLNIGIMTYPMYQLIFWMYNGVYILYLDFGVKYTWLVAFELFFAYLTILAIIILFFYTTYVKTDRNT